MPPEPPPENRPDLSDAVRNRQPATPTPEAAPRRSRLFFLLLAIIVIAIAILIWASLRH